MTAYATPTTIAAYLGVTLTSGQQTQAGVVAQAISDWIDHETGRSWQVSSPVSGEVHAVTGDRVFLNQRPVTAITSVETRADVIGAIYTTLAAGQYELIDATNGVLQLIGWGNYLARVAYTHGATTPPSDIALAATILASELMTATLHPESAGVDSIAVGQNDLAVKFSSSANPSPDVARALQMIQGRRMPVIA